MTTAASYSFHICKMPSAMIRIFAFVCSIICLSSVAYLAAAAPTPNGATAFVGQINALPTPHDNSYVLYKATIELGTPPQVITLTLDTTVDLTIVSTKSFSPADSSTYTSLPHLPDPTAVFSSDTVTLNSTNGLVPLQAVSVKGIEFLLSRVKADLLALGNASTAFPAQISSASGVAKKFAYCLGQFAGAKVPTPIFFGNTSYYFDSGLPPQSNGVPYPEYDITPYLKYTPLVKARIIKEGYAVHITSIGVNEELSNGSLIHVDEDAAIGTETLYTSLTEPFYTEVRQAFLNSPAVKGSFPLVPGYFHGPLDLCFNFTGQIGLIRASPIITFNFEGNTSLPVTYTNYLVDVDDANNIYCFGFVSGGLVKGSSMIGTFQQVDNLVEFDLEKERVGFSGSLIALRSSCKNFNFTSA